HCWIAVAVPKASKWSSSREARREYPVRPMRLESIIWGMRLTMWLPRTVTWRHKGDRRSTHLSARSRARAPVHGAHETVDRQHAAKPGWRNGRRDGLKNHCPKGRAGSTPAPGTACLSRTTEP